MRKLFFANWKTYLNDAEAEALACAYAERAAGVSVEVAIAPSFTALERVSRAIEGSPLALGAQDVFWSDAGAHTGEIPPKLLATLGVKYVVVGHSERRALGETDEVVARKAAAVAADGMTAVVCLGETKEEREAGHRETVVREQLRAVLKDGSSQKQLIVAYEPRWAIGSGTPCEPSEVEAMHAIIRSELESHGLSTRILYGGSVGSANLKAYIEIPNVDGVLIGGASTRVDDVRAMFDLLSS